MTSGPNDDGDRRAPTAERRGRPRRERRWSRRDVTVAGLGAAVGLAGCLDSEPDDVNVPGAGSFSTITVPGGIERLTLVDAQQAAGDDATLAGTAALLDSNAFAALPASLLAAFEPGSVDGFDLARVGNVAFVAGEVSHPRDEPSSRGPGVVLWADLDVADVLGALEAAEADTETYQRQTLHGLEDGVAVEITDDVTAFDASVFAIGDDAMVRAVIDNWQGADVHPADDDLYGFFEHVPADAPTKFTCYQPDRDCTEVSGAGAIESAPIVRVSGFLSPDDDDPVASVSLQALSGAGARDAEAAARAELLGEGADGSTRETPALPEAVVEDVTVDRVDDRVTVAYGGSNDRAAGSVDRFLETVLCSVPTFEGPS